MDPVDYDIINGEGDPDPDTDTTTDESETEEERDRRLQEAEAQAESMDSLREDASQLKDMLSTISSVGKKLMAFVVKNIAMASIFYGISVTIGKLTKKKSTPSVQKTALKMKRDLILAVNKLITMETTKSKELAVWMNKNKDVYVNLEDIAVPVSALFQKYLDPMEKAVDNAYLAAKSLRIVSHGTINYNIPTEAQLNDLLKVAGDFYEALKNIETFLNENKEKIPELQTVPLTENDMARMHEQLQLISDLPIA